MIWNLCLQLEPLARTFLRNLLKTSWRKHDSLRKLLTPVKVDIEVQYSYLYVQSIQTRHDVETEDSSSMLTTTFPYVHSPAKEKENKKWIYNRERINLICRVMKGSDKEKWHAACLVWRLIIDSWAMLARCPDIGGQVRMMLEQKLSWI